MITFLTPLFLVGMLAAAIPLVIHLSRSRRTRKIRFSTTRFFDETFMRSYRMSRLKELWLLAARMALFALFAAALARPMVLPSGRAWRAGKRCVVLVIDNSASMAYVENGRSLLDRARDAAVEILDTLKPGDAASIVLAARRDSGPRILFPQPTPDLAAVRSELNGIGAEELGTDLGGAVDSAQAVADEVSGFSREIYVLSDLQETGWDPPGAASSGEDTTDTLFFCVHLRPLAPRNLAVTALQYASVRPIPGIPYLFRPHIVNLGAEPIRAEVALHVDGRKVGARTLDSLAPGRWAAPRFHYTFAAGGRHTGYVEIEDPRFAPDNRRYFAVDVIDRLSMLAVNGSPSTVAARDELFFLRMALAADADRGSAIVLTETDPDDMASVDLDGYALVLLANVPALAPASVERLERYVDRGGALLVALGDQVDAVFYNRYLAAPERLHGGLLPARLQDVTGDPEDEATFSFVADVDVRHSALAGFRPEELPAFNAVRFHALWTSLPGDHDVLLGMNTGEPLLLERRYGKGTVMLFTGALDRDWSNLPICPLYLPLMHRLVAYLGRQPANEGDFKLTGQRIGFPLSAVEGVQDVVVRGPDGATHSLAATGDPEIPLAFDGMDRAGVYEATPGDRVFVANLDRLESDFAGVGRLGDVEQALRRLNPGRPFLQYVEDPAATVVVAERSRRGVRLWDLLLVAVLLLALFEPWLANRISLRHYARPGGEDSPGRDRM